MLKNISKLFLFVFALSATSCSDEEIQNTETEANYQTKKAGVYNCPLDNQNRITEDVFFYGGFYNNVANCDIVGNQNDLGCFPNILRKTIQTEFLKGPKGNSTQTNYTDEIDLDLFEIEDIPNLDLYEFISPQYSNKLYRYIACEIQEYLSSLPSLPSNQYYFPRATYVGTDFLFLGPEWNSSYLSFHYNVEIKFY